MPLLSLLNKIDLMRSYEPHMKQAVLSIFILLILTACGLQGANILPTPTRFPAAKTLIITNVPSTSEAAASTSVYETQLAPIFGTTAVQKTQTAEASATTSAESALLATQTAQPMQALVEGLKNDGYLTSSEGTYYQLGTFDKSWAQLNWYRWWDTSYSPENFVIHTYSSWWTASRKANWSATGCGFVFHEQDENNQYFIVLSLDGVVSLHRIINGVKTRVAHNLYGDVGVPDGSAEITLAVENGWITFLVNGKTTLRTKDTFLPSGKLALSLISGTNSDFGTRCEMKDIELWILK